MAAEVAEVLRDQGVEVRLRSRAHAVRREASGEVVVTLAGGSDVRGRELLCATGRTPVTAGLDLEAAGVELTNRGFVVVDDHLRTTASHVWAVGDVAGSPQFTHASWNDFRILKKNLAGENASTSGRLMPYTVFTTPELGRVGMTETEARARGHRVRIAKIPAAAIPRAKTLHMATGSWKAVIDEDTEQILGVALLGHEAGEVIATVQMAMLGGLRYHQVRDAPITHPTMAEGLNLLLDAV
jgi:pyruvate/2-oxoglutarate dehydrogenase complex dihydrolipoamide dehydrogenase (E3) component